MTTKTVEKSYLQACHNYGIGFSSAFSWAAMVCGYGILWKQHIPETLYYTCVVSFVVFSVIALVVIVASYTYPIRIYELLGDGTDD